MRYYYHILLATFRIALSVLCVVIASGCRGTAEGYGITLRMLPEEERVVVENYLNIDKPGIVSVHYGPEWRSLTVISRILDNGELMATEHRWRFGSGGPFVQSASPRILYRTTSPRIIRMFHDFRRQIGEVEKQTDDYPTVITSNPQWVAHVVPGEAELVVRHPWANQNCYWLANAVVLMRHAVSDPDEREGAIVVPADWWHSSRTRHAVATGVRLNEFGSFDTWPGLYMHIAISYFDLEQKYVSEMD